MHELLNATTAASYRQQVGDTAATVADRIGRTTTPCTAPPRAVLQRQVDLVDLDGTGCGTDEALAEIDELFTANAVFFHDAGYMAHLNCPVALPAIAAETVIAAINPSLDTYDQSTAGTLMERRLIDWTAGRIGFDGGDGIFTSGGSQSNLQGLMLARDAALNTVDVSQQRLVVLATASSHFSVQKSCRILGLADTAVQLVDTDDEGRMRPDALREAIERTRAAGLEPMCVVATAGTTDRGCLDPLGPIADACDEAGVWLHVDAAYGCGLLVSPTRRHLLDGIERARSVTVDFHKSFFQPVSSSALVVADPADLSSVTWHADYLNPLGEPDPNQVDKSLQTTRRFDALKLWATLRALGPDRIGSMFDQVIDLAADTADRLALDPRFELVCQPRLSTVLFRLSPLVTDDPDGLVAPVRQLLLERGATIIAKTVIDGRPCFKITLLNPDTTPGHVDRMLDAVEAAADQLEPPTPSLVGLPGTARQEARR